MEPLSTIAMQLAALTQLKATGGPLNACELVLFQNAIVPNKSTLLAALTLATFTGYAAVTAIAFGTPYIDPTGRIRMDAPSVEFIMTDTVSSQTIYGWALLNTGGTALILAGQLNPPIPLTLASQGFSIQPTYAYGD